MEASHRRSLSVSRLNKIIKQVLVDTSGLIEELGSFHDALTTHIRVPFNAGVIGEPVSVVSIDFSGDQRHALTATCRRANGMQYRISVTDLMVSREIEGVEYLAAYRKWMNLPLLEDGSGISREKTRNEGPSIWDQTELSLAILSVGKRVNCRSVENGEFVVLHLLRSLKPVPGEVVRIKPFRQWTESGRKHVSGEVLSTGIDAAALKLTPLELREFGIWNPAEEDWMEPGERLRSWARPIMQRGPRPMFEMQQVLPGEDPDQLDDPIIQAVDLAATGNQDAARRILMELCEADLRCLDAHAHLGLLHFDNSVEQAIRHFEVGLRIGELSLGPEFDGVLPWGMIDNRPFLRNLHGYGLCLWRQHRFKQAVVVFEKLLWLNPSDNQGVRFEIEHVRKRRPWAMVAGRRQ